jgi:hypothetical protein
VVGDVVGDVVVIARACCVVTRALRCVGGVGRGPARWSLSCALEVALRLAAELAVVRSWKVRSFLQVSYVQYWTPSVAEFARTAYTGCHIL